MHEPLVNIGFPQYPLSPTPNISISRAVGLPYLAVGAKVTLEVDLLVDNQ